MQKCHISIMCNELFFLKEKLNFLYENFDQLIFVDYNIFNKCNSIDGSIEYIKSFDDKYNKIKLIMDFDPNKITRFHGESFIEKQKMFAEASKYVHDDIDIIWATDLDEFFDMDLINRVENEFNKDKNLQSIDIPHKIFVYNQYNYYNKNDFYICPRITRHKKNFIYGHCNFQKYGKTIKLSDYFFYHFAFIGYKRCKFKYELYNNKLFNKNEWLKIYLMSLNNNIKHVKLIHNNVHLNLYSTPYLGTFPKYINIERMVSGLNKID